MKKVILVFLISLFCLLFSCKTYYHYDIEVTKDNGEILKIFTYSSNVGLRNGCLTIDSFKVYLCGIKKINSITKEKDSK